MNSESIKNKFSNISFNNNNYDIGGGLVSHKFASNRHEDAKSDFGKKTKGVSSILTTVSKNIL